MKFLLPWLLFGSASHALPAFVAEGVAVQYRPKYTSSAKDTARENARMQAFQRCRRHSQHIQRISPWAYKRKGIDVIVARATFVCLVPQAAGD